MRSRVGHSKELSLLYVLSMKSNANHNGLSQQTSLEMHIAVVLRHCVRHVDGDIVSQRPLCGIVPRRVDSPCVYRRLGGSSRLITTPEQLLCCVLIFLLAKIHSANIDEVFIPQRLHSLYFILTLYILISRYQKRLSPFTIPIYLFTMRILSLSTSCVALAGIIHALRTVPSSPCADKCGDITNTTSSEIVCKDIDYNTPAGRAFEECITCQLGSNATDPSTGDSDLKWLLCKKS